MSQLEEKKLPNEVKAGLKREEKQKKVDWWKKHWKWVVPTVVAGLVAVIALLLLIVTNIIADIQSRQTLKVLKACDDYKNEVLDLSRFSALEALTIGDGCFNYVSKVSVVGLKKLKSVAIGTKSFQNESNDSELVVSDCPELTSLSIGNESFKGFKEMKLSEVKALKTITIGDECLKDCDLVLRDLKSVESVVIGVNSFEKSRHSVVESANYSKK